jgi:ATP-dependent DNA helicase RecG
MKRYPEMESSLLEWKETLPQKQPIYKTVIGFCNQNGGKIVLGVKDDGIIIGLPQNLVEELLENLERDIYQACSPPIVPRVFAKRIEDKSIVIIEVSAGMNKPYYITAEGLEQGTYVRIGPHTVKANAAMIEELRWQSRGIHFETMLQYRAGIKELDDKKIRDFLASRRSQKKVQLNEAIMKAYHLVGKEHGKTLATNAGILLFGKRPQHFFSEAMIICTHFGGTSGRDVVATIDCEGTIFEQFETAFAFLLNRLSRSFVIRGAKREETLEIPEEAIREALLNAIIHRNYHQASPTRVSIYDDQVEILSPGTFPGPLDATTLKAGLTFLRNPLICRIFREADYVEKMGTGLLTIFNSYEKRGLQDPQIFEVNSFVKCVLPRKFKPGPSLLSEDAKNIEEIFKKQGEVTLNQLVKALPFSRPTIWRRIQELLEKEIIERIGQTRGAKYRYKR